MSKLAHSNDATMAEIEVNAAFAAGNFDRLDLVPLYKPPRCEAKVKQGQWDEASQNWDGRCSFGAKYETGDGSVLCEMHAKAWALDHHR